ncbi:uncharacterized protein LOC130645528 [Hydractinia symbiolongicarpus]|uniref:uncharacterized protein LOC130645528 n=1 Tax=Hydractinia symbiolongicarpus TaxID=13093 RepID=UPI00255148EA|nr:uncharacterized protein LOC130645528 [Hydractinia symbiolongicarpus]
MESAPTLPNEEEKPKNPNRRIGVCESLILAAKKQTEEIEKEKTAHQEFLNSQPLRKLKCKKDYDEFQDTVALQMIFHEFSAADLLNPSTGIGVEALYKLMDDLMEDVEKDTVRAWINEYDKDSNGLIDITEFVQVMLDKIMQVTDTQEEVLAAFKEFDKDNTGFINLTELLRIMSLLGDPLSDEEMNLFMLKSDIDGDGMVNYEEFVRLMFGKNEKAKNPHQGDKKKKNVKGT